MSKRTFDEIYITGAINIPDLTAAVPNLEASVTEINQVKNASSANSTASKAAVLDSSKRLRTAANTGTPESTITQVTVGDGRSMTTTLTLTATPVTIGDNAALGVGTLLYTLPAGVQFIEQAYISVGLTATDAANAADTPEIGIGTTIGVGAISALTTTMENIVVGTAVADCTGTAKVLAQIPTANVPLVRLSGDVKTIYLNYAATWANNTVQTATASGTVVIKWTHLA